MQGNTIVLLEAMTTNTRHIMTAAIFAGLYTQNAAALDSEPEILTRLITVSKEIVQLIVRVEP